MAITKVIIVGSGPAGLVLALLLAKQGINVLILEAAEKLDENPRATHYASPATYELERAGVLQEVINEGFLPGGVAWRDIDGHSIASLSTNDLPREDKIVCLPLNRLTEILMSHIAEQPNAEVRWSHKVLPTIGQDPSSAWIMVETPSGTEKFSGDYIVGCDGANSQIRKSLFGDWEFPGRTWDEQIVATNVYYDMTPYNWEDSNFIIDKAHWFMLAKIQKDGLLRITYGDIPGLTREEYVARQPMKFKSFLPGRPDPDKYRVENISPYKVHQRCAKSFREGRFLLVADAAHLCNPFGGLGLTGGLVDAGNLFDCLNGIHQGLVSDDILSRYDIVRREKYTNIIDPVSSENIRRLWQDPVAARKEDKFLEMCRKAEKDPVFSRTMQEGLKAIMHDFRKEYQDVSPNETEQKTAFLPPTTHVAVTAGDA
ncbi:FAD/NAD(P)-binding domain-containing protein [Cadophora sp. DSE1049]|nr:FAD/NAD(P)-binding domain-containing protein [Cadophora sp. DSE1049]